MKMGEAFWSAAAGCRFLEASLLAVQRLTGLGDEAARKLVGSKRQQGAALQSPRAA